MTLAIAPARLKTMLELQTVLNQKVNPQWLEAGYAWHRAAWIEAAELADSVGWKWWKKQEPDLSNVRVEIVDLWHFALSATLQTAAGDLENAIDALSVASVRTPPPATLQEVLLPEIDRFIGDCAFGMVSAGRVLFMAEAAGMTANQLYVLYVGKNLLNLFRQDHGYKQGTYVKDWAGEEDNAYMSRLLANLPDQEPSFYFGQLAARYAEVTEQAA